MTTKDVQTFTQLPPCPLQLLRIPLAKTFGFADFPHDSAKPKQVWLCSRCFRNSHPRYKNPDTDTILLLSVYGNFSAPIYSVSNASVPSVRCSSKSSSVSASFSPPLSLRNPLRPRVTPAA